MNPCNVTIDIFGEPSTFECSSHETAVSITDVFQDHRAFGCSYRGIRHFQSVWDWRTETWSRQVQPIDSDIDHEVDYSFHETFGAAHGWL